MSACDMLGVKTQTFGPNVAVAACGQRLVEESAPAPAARAVSAAAPRTTALTRRRTIRCIKEPHFAEWEGGTYDNATVARPASRRPGPRRRRRRAIPMSFRPTRPAPGREGDDWSSRRLF